MCGYNTVTPHEGHRGCPESIGARSDVKKQLTSELKICDKETEISICVLICRLSRARRKRRAAPRKVSAIYRGKLPIDCNLGPWMCHLESVLFNEQVGKDYRLVVSEIITARRAF